MAKKPTSKKAASKKKAASNNTPPAAPTWQGNGAASRLALRREYAAKVKAERDPVRRTELRRELRGKIKG